MVKNWTRLKVSYLFSIVIAIAIATPANLQAGCTIFSLQEDDQDSVEDLMAEATAMLQREKYTEAAAILQKVVDQDEENGQAWMLLGYSLHVGGEVEKAIEAHTRAATFEDFKPVALYNLGCAHALLEDTEASIQWLEKAVDAGFSDIEYLTTDTDLDGVRDDERFKALVARVKNGGEPVFNASMLVGTWEMLEGVRAGEELDGSRLPPSFEMTADTFELTGPGGTGSFVMGYEIDSSASPMTIDMKIDEGPVMEDGTDTVGAPALGIIKFDDGKIWLCYDAMGGARPETFESTEENGYHLFVAGIMTPPLTAELLAGEWQIVGGARGGEEIGEDRLPAITITEETITIPAGADEFVMSYEIDNSTSPANIDMSIESGPAPAGAPAVGIIKMEGDMFNICYDGMGGERPADFESTAENGCFLFKCKRD
ncbi:MAG: TIGR03067 domain-containing protein [Planctomycetota bacterium]